MTVLVTGGGGFLGGAIVQQLLAQGERVRSVSRGDYPALREQGVETMRGDLADEAVAEQAVRGCDTIFHVAAKPGVWGPYRAYFRANVLATRNLLNAARQHGVRKFIYTSTPSVVHKGGDIEGADESLPYATHFATHYPQTKAEAEQAVLAANSPTLSTVALRPHLIWGPGDPNLVARIVSRARAGRLRLVGRTPKLVDTTYIDNAAHAHLLAAQRLHPEAACAGKAYFITNHEPMLQDDIINGILHAAGLPPVTRRVPAGVAYVVGAMLEAIYTLLRKQDEPMMTRFVAKQLSTAHWYNPEAATRDLGYTPRITVAQGLERLRAQLRHEA